jgi:hypothetical protein
MPVNRYVGIILYAYIYEIKIMPGLIQTRHLRSCIFWYN